MQLRERLMARCHAEREGTRGDSVGRRADGVTEGTKGAGRADDWLEGDQPCPDLGQRGVARENGTRPIQGDRPSGFIRHDHCDCECCSRDEVEGRRNANLHERATVRFASADQRRFDKCGSDRSRSHIRRPRRKDSCGSTPASNHDHRSGEKDPVLSCVSPRRRDQLGKRGLQRPRLRRSGAVHLTLYTSLACLCHAAGGHSGTLAQARSLAPVGTPEAPTGEVLCAPGLRSSGYRTPRRMWGIPRGATAPPCSVSRPRVWPRHRSSLRPGRAGRMARTSGERH